jgi:hypothetical protein
MSGAGFGPGVGEIGGGGLTGIPIIGQVIQGLGEIFQTIANVGDLAQKTETAIENTWGNAITDASWAFGEAGKLWDHLKKIFGEIGTALADFWKNHLKGILDKIIGAIKKLHDKLAKILKPLQKFIKRIRDWYLKHIFPWQRLALQIISAMRVFLELLRLLHVKWATQLDQTLQKIQGYITESITAILGPLNQALTVLGLAVDPGLFFAHDMFGRTLWNSLGDVKKAAGFGSGRPVLAAEQAQEQDQKHAVYGTQPLQTVGPDGSVEYDPALKLVDDSLTQQMRTQGVTP